MVIASVSDFNSVDKKIKSPVLFVFSSLKFCLISMAVNFVTVSRKKALCQGNSKPQFLQPILSFTSLSIT